MKSKFSLKGLTFIKSSSHSQGGLSHVTQKTQVQKNFIVIKALLFYVLHHTHLTGV